MYMHIHIHVPVLRTYTQLDGGYVYIRGNGKGKA